MATLVERTSGFLNLIPLTRRDSLTVSQAIIAVAGYLPASLKRPLTWDCGTEIARHGDITEVICLPRGELATWQAEAM